MHFHSTVLPTFLGDDTQVVVVEEAMVVVE